ncbi:MAG: hydroxymethylbilane synthase [Pirellulales bacterium]
MARRKSQLRYARPDLEYLEIRGNVDTRLRKLHDGDYDAIILAAAGLTRLGWAMKITERLSKDLMLPAVGQGALGLETRSDDEAARAAVFSLDHASSHTAVLAERTLLAELRGGCSAPIGAWGRFTAGNELTLTAVVLSPDGTERIAAEERATIAPNADWATLAVVAERLGKETAMLLIQAGAERMIWARAAKPLNHLTFLRIHQELPVGRGTLASRKVIGPARSRCGRYASRLF